MNEHEWEEDEKSPEKLDINNDVAAYRRLTDQIKNLIAKASEIKERIVAEFPEEPGEWSRTYGDLTLTLKRPERWTWDAEALKKMYAEGDGLPVFISRKSVIDKKKFQAQPQTIRDDHLHALTRGPGTAAISITEQPRS